MSSVDMLVQLVGFTQFETPEWIGDWEPNSEGTAVGQDLIEFAGRACYQSWSRPNAATAQNSAYIENIKLQRHFSVLEHASATFYITGVSRSLTHELIRHRHLSFSELSQRFVDVETANHVVPPALRSVVEHPAAAMDSASGWYKKLMTILNSAPGLTRKHKREAARSAMPNMTETRIVVTGNYRAWRHFIAMRATEHADVEIRELAIEILDQLSDIAPDVFSDFQVTSTSDGYLIATSTLREAE